MDDKNRARVKEKNSVGIDITKRRWKRKKEFSVREKRKAVENNMFEVADGVIMSCT